MNCPKCQSIMVRDIDTVLAAASYPPILIGRWWCGCGHAELFRETQPTREEELRKAWENVNRWNKSSPPTTRYDETQKGPWS